MQPLDEVVLFDEAIVKNMAEAKKPANKSRVGHS
jgi:hypothetical protein